MEVIRNNKRVANLRLFYSIKSDIRFVPDFCLLASGRHSLIADLQDEVALLKCPLAVSTYEGESLGRQLEGDSLYLTRLQLNLREVAQALVVRND